MNWIADQQVDELAPKKIFFPKETNDWNSPLLLKQYEFFLSQLVNTPMYYMLYIPKQFCIDISETRESLGTSTIKTSDTKIGVIGLRNGS